MITEISGFTQYCLFYEKWELQHSVSSLHIWGWGASILIRQFCCYTRPSIPSVKHNIQSRWFCDVFDHSRQKAINQKHEYPSFYDSAIQATIMLWYDLFSIFSTPESHYSSEPLTSFTVCASVCGRICMPILCFLEPHVRQTKQNRTKSTNPREI